LLKKHCAVVPAAPIFQTESQSGATNAFFYPDVFVTCDERDHQTELLLSYPKLIAEVLSDSTAAFDRSDKSPSTGKSRPGGIPADRPGQAGVPTASGAIALGIGCFMILGRMT
jgi:hypothetical protein